MDNSTIFGNKFGVLVPDQGQSVSLPIQEIATAVGYLNVDDAVNEFKDWAEKNGMAVFDLSPGIIILGRRLG